MVGTAVFAPGKLMVIGEYAVLHGARALVTAVDAGIECRTVPRQAGWWLHAPDLGVDAPMAQAGADGRARLLTAAVAAGAEAFGPGSPMRVTVRGRGALAGRKVGLGGSAACVAGVLGAMAAAAGRDPAQHEVRDAVFDLAFAVHRAHQRGRGSGADVAASVYGGWIEYRLDRGVPRVAQAGSAGMLLEGVWTGTAADTGSSLSRFEEGLSGAGLLDRMEAVLTEFWAAHAAGDRPQMLGAIGRYGDALDHLAGLLGHRGSRRRSSELVRAATDCGVAGKGSGAVGGDCVIGLGFDALDLHRARAAWRRLGAEVLDLTAGVDGIRLVPPRHGA